ncbi:hypothetical protein N186_03900 [Thermofilum adornatum]|jgi:ribosomal protein L44E|uniref:Uncharacterized protein n=1 Tax=Thermofilum adornatum TaxID=1365176 RepID=S5ZVH7_9CREN|nr:hypothetical protein [Thermofilum adornatum]AGT35139.1 hypothetical protein N186_03900 [Thermofilum adornatum]
MSKWRLRCEKCSSERVLDLGFNLYEFKKVYLYCPRCQENTPHVVLGVEAPEAVQA